ncbi:MAG: hypothetical protein CMJ59_16360 [Planctomycetaceae bacterium]|nr:hypothetical protein [Planctomycetaceae bacterium]
MYSDRLAVPFAVALVGFVAAPSWGAGSTPSTPDLEFFEKRVRPLLIRRCHRCHSANAKTIQGGLRLDTRAGVLRGGDNGPVIAAGQPTASRLIQAIRYGGAIKMPPDSRLAADEIAVLVRWVQIGAPWPNAPSKDLSKIGGDEGFPLEERKRNQWCWQPIRDPRLPRVDGDWPISSIDRFLFARMRAHDLHPAATADRSIWLRRVTFDLIGLPPSPPEVTSFAADTTPVAYARVVERLLASPRFGEHWARHWMDLVRYAETKAFESDYTMPYAFRYRDYLIRALNADVPYNQFIREHIAGDLLEQPRRNPADGSLESALGTGYWYLNDGHHGPTDVHGDEVRVFENMIDVTSKVFLAQTLACARCHDHKFDPITTRDYYSLYGVLASSRFEYVNTISPDLLTSRRQQLQRQRERIQRELSRIWTTDLRTLREQLATAQSLDPLQKLEAWRGLLERAPGTDSKPLPRPKGSSLAPLQPIADVLSSPADRLAPSWQKWSQQAPSKPRERLGGLSHESFGEWLAAGTGFGDQPMVPGSLVLARTGEQVVRTLVRGPAAGHLSSRFDGSIKSPMFELGNSVSVRVKGRHARVRLFVQHYELVGQGVTTGNLDQQVNSDQWVWITIDTRLWKGLRAYLEVLHNGDEMQVVMLRQHAAEHADDSYVAIDDATLGGPRQTVTVGDYVQAWRIAGSAPPSQVAAAVFVVDRISALLARWPQEGLTTAESDVLEALLQCGILAATVDRSPAVESLVKVFRAQARSVPKPIYARGVTDGHGRDEPVYLRGDHQQMSPERVPRHFLAALDTPPFSGSGSGRREWADAVVHPENPLASRVIVNRIWSYLMGRGMVASVDNFGEMGARPTHPDLLDHLAHRFMRDGWSLKQLIRKITLSRAYRMSTRPSAQAQRTDPAGVWLSYLPLRRLPAESIRDAILVASGRLQRRMFGPSVPVNLQQTIPSRSKPTDEGPVDGNGRRSVYIEMRRNYLPNFLCAFDLPNASVTRGQRSVTNVPIQALTLMNDPFVIEQAHLWAEHIVTDSRSLRERINGLHLTAFARAATDAEQRKCQAFIVELAKQFKIETADAGDDARVWTEICHLMINRKEFIFLVGQK